MIQSVDTEDRGHVAGNGDFALHESGPFPLSKRLKIMIGIPGYAAMVPHCQENFFAFAYRLGRDYPGYDFFLRIIIKKEQFRARNNLVTMALANGCDYLLMLDDDMLIPDDLLGRLMKHGKDVIGALYWQRSGAFHPVILWDNPKPSGEVGIKFVGSFDTMLVNRGLYQVDIIGGGCMLFKMEVFAKLLSPYFWWEAHEGTDVALCRRLREQGIEIWVDTSIELGHVGEPQIVNSRTIPKYNAEIGAMREEMFDDVSEYLGMPGEQLREAMIHATEKAQRVKHWGDRDGESWEDVLSYYQEGGDWHVLNIAGYTIGHDLESRRFAITELDRVVPRGGKVLDWGCGVGSCVIPLAKQGYSVTAVDLVNTPTMRFLATRAAKHGLHVELCHMGNPIPSDYLPLLPDAVHMFDAALLISAIDHLFAPYETLEYIIAHLVADGYLVCDWEQIGSPDERQHLMRYDIHTFQQWMKDHGMFCTPDKSWLFKKEAA